MASIHRWSRFHHAQRPALCHRWRTAGAFSLPREVLPTLAWPRTATSSCRCRSRPRRWNFRYHEDYNVIGALKPGVSVAAAQAEMDLITTRLRREHPQEYPPNGGLTFSIVPLLEQVVGNVRTTLGILSPPSASCC